MWSKLGPSTSWLWLVSPELDRKPIHHLNTEPFMGWNIMEGLWCRRTDYDSIPIWDCSGHGFPANDLNMWDFQILLVLFALWSIADTMLREKTCFRADYRLYWGLLTKLASRWWQQNAYYLITWSYLVLVIRVSTLWTGVVSKHSSSQHIQPTPS